MIAVPGVRIGHWTDEVGETGCTVVTFPEGTVASHEIRGGAPATRELDALSPEKAVVSVDAVVLTGGSAFGLASADGVMRYLEEQGRGVPTPAGRVPIVPTLVVFDLGAGDFTARPTADSGYAAARATTGDQIRTGRIGDVVVAAICVVNAFGDIDDGTAEVSLDAVAQLADPFRFDSARAHTTIGVVATNARLDKTGCRIVAQGAHDGLARALTPPHTRFDGDGFVAAATGQVPVHVDAVRLMALAAVTDSIHSLANRIDRDQGTAVNSS